MSKQQKQHIQKNSEGKKKIFWKIILMKQLIIWKHDLFFLCSMFEFQSFIIFLKKNRMKIHKFTILLLLHRIVFFYQLNTVFVLDIIISFLCLFFVLFFVNFFLFILFFHRFCFFIYSVSLFSFLIFLLFLSISLFISFL
jgi:hypothetical protein